MRLCGPRRNGPKLGIGVMRMSQDFSLTAREMNGIPQKIVFPCFPPADSLFLAVQLTLFGQLPGQDPV